MDALNVVPIEIGIIIAIPLALLIVTLVKKQRGRKRTDGVLIFDMGSDPVVQIKFTKGFEELIKKKVVNLSVMTYGLGMESDDETTQ